MRRCLTCVGRRSLCRAPWGVEVEGERAGSEGGAGAPARGEKARKPGLKIGPVTFVFELRGGDTGDPWAHRKGEPRLFALGWTVFLMVAATLTVMSSRIVSPAVPRHAFGVRAMLVMAALGVCVLWPMTRLCQAPPKRPVRATVADIVVLLVPLQALVWPLPLLANWGFDVAAGFALMYTSWALVIGVAVLGGTWTRSVGDRVVWMGACVVLTCAAPVARLLLPAGATPEAWGLASPLSGVFALTAAPSGFTPTMDGVEWAMVVAPLGVAAVGWAVVIGSGGRVYARGGAP